MRDESSLECKQMCWSWFLFFWRIELYVKQIKELIADVKLAFITAQNARANQILLCKSRSCNILMLVWCSYSSLPWKRGVVCGGLICKFGMTECSDGCQRKGKNGRKKGIVCMFPFLCVCPRCEADLRGLIPTR